MKEILQVETPALRGPKHSPYLGSECRVLPAQGGELLQQTLGLACSRGRPGTRGQGLQGPWGEEGGQPWAILQGLYLNSCCYC